jgi:hypothetical protein
VQSNGKALEHPVTLSEMEQWRCRVTRASAYMELQRSLDIAETDLRVVLRFLDYSLQQYPNREESMDRLKIEMKALRALAGLCRTKGTMAEALSLYKINLGICQALASNPKAELLTLRLSAQLCPCPKGCAVVAEASVPLVPYFDRPSKLQVDSHHMHFLSHANGPLVPS